MESIIAQLIDEFKLNSKQVQNTVKLIDEGNTIPFIARYRKEMTGELDDQVLRELHERLVYLRNLDERRKAVERLIEEQGKLTEELRKGLLKATSLQEIEDIYRPYKPKRKTKATIAKEKGLEPLASLIYLQTPVKNGIIEAAKAYINVELGVNSVEDALEGAMHILSEEVSDDALNRKLVRDRYMSTGKMVSRAKIEEDSVYRMYYNFSESVAKIAKHRVLALNRGEKEAVLQVSLEVEEEPIIQMLQNRILKKPSIDSTRYLSMAIEDAYHRLIAPSIENEVRNELTEKAEEQAMKVFATNLRHLLLQPPIKGNVVLALDPAYRTGCKLAVVDATGRVLEVTVIYPTPPQNKIEASTAIMKQLIEKYHVEMIAIGNGTASKESEIFVVNLLKELDRKLYYMVVSEAGASVYSASKIGAEEFPDFDVSLRSAVSIARRLQDPLAELVKIDPKAIGVGQYQHDMNQKKLGENLGSVVEDCVNNVGVDLNTASASLLSYVSGINSSVAKNIVEYREEQGRIKSRKELKKVKKLGAKAFEQCAGFMRIQNGAHILDNTAVHPESYDAACKLLEITGYTLEDVKNRNIGALNTDVAGMGYEVVAKQIGVGVPTLKDIVKELLKPGRDPRDELPKPMLLTDVLDIKDLKAGMVMTGTVRNVADFGAFVDIGVHQDGLVHISELRDQFVKNPMEVVAVGDIVKVKILEVDVPRKRISLSMKGF